MPSLPIKTTEFEDWLGSPDNYARLLHHYGGQTEDLIFWARRSNCKSDPLNCPACALRAFIEGRPMLTKEFQCAPC